MSRTNCRKQVVGSPKPFASNNRAFALKQLSVRFADCAPSLGSSFNSIGQANLMGKFSMFLVATTVLVAPMQVNAQPKDIRPGAFAGIRFQLSLGGQARTRPKAGFAIAPTQTRISDDGTVRTRMGEGLSLDLTAGTQPKLTLAGLPANTWLSLQTKGRVNSSEKSNVSETGWVAIGVGLAAVAAAVGFILVLDEAKHNSD
jgi:hypothetical protein